MSPPIENKSLWGDSYSFPSRRGRKDNDGRYSRFILRNPWRHRHLRLVVIGFLNLVIKQRDLERQELQREEKEQAEVFQKT